jgi:hypothetical protein
MRHPGRKSRAMAGAGRFSATAGADKALDAIENA